MESITEYQDNGLYKISVENSKNYPFPPDRLSLNLLGQSPEHIFQINIMREKMTKSENKSAKLKIEIRQSKISDVEEINELERLVFSPKMRYGPSLIVAIINTSLPCLALTAELKHQNKIVGFIAGEIEEASGQLGRIITIEVDPQYQHHHIGEQLLRAFERNLGDHYAIKNLELQVHFENHNAINFYRKHGFRKIKKLKNYYARKEHAILMQKSID